MTTVKFLASLNNLGIKIWIEDNQLRYRAPKGVMTSALKQELVERKAEIIAFVKEAKTPQQFTSEPILPVKRDSDLPLSFPQQRMWFLYQLDSQTPFYNENLQLRIIGALNVSALEQSLNEIIRRHEALRTIFPTVDGFAVQRIIPTLTLNIPVVDLQGLKEAEVQQIITKEVRQPFDLSKPPLLRVTLLGLEPEFHLLILTIHHIIMDGWSIGIFIKELSALYQAFSTNSPTPLSELTIQYGDFTIWQRQWLTEELQKRQLNYWKQQLADAPLLLDLPTDYPRPSVQTFSGALKEFKLNSNLTAQLKSLSQKLGTTLFVTLLAAFASLLHRYSGQDDICIGSPFANRNRTEIEPLIGFFVNTLVLRTQIKENPSFSDFITQVQQVVLDAYAHQDVPFEQIVEVLQPARSPSYNPLFQVMFALENISLDAFESAGITMTPEIIERGTAKFDLSLLMFETQQGIIGSWEYNTDLFDETTIRAMVGHFETLLEGIVANRQQRVSELPLLTQRERNQLLFEWNNTTKDYPHDKCIHQLFEEQVERTPDAVAVVFEGEQLTYRELNAKANQLANYLQTLGVKPEILVGICVERGLEMLVGLLGILKAGGAYVPLDPKYPIERLSFMLEDTQVPVLLTQQQLLEKLPQHQAYVVCLDTDWQFISQSSQDNGIATVQASNLAYVIYTSGSTGRPKGVTIPHGAIANHCGIIQQAYALVQSDRVLQFASINFDASLEQIFPTLIVGATLVMRGSDVWTPTSFQKIISDFGLTVVNLPTAYWQQLAQEWIKTQVLDTNSQLRLVLVGGDVMLPEYVTIWQQSPMSCVRLVNAYGPTETTITATLFEILPQLSEDINLKKIPIGRPLPNKTVYILDRNLQPVPIGVPGELYIGGACLAKGYLNCPELTQEKFILNPFSDATERLYKTGDLARYLSDGNIEYLGRIDNQVKIRGFRIELGEIEAVLAQHPDVREAVVMVREDIPSNKLLVAYIVSNLIPERIPYHNECQLELDGNMLNLHTEDISNGGVGLLGLPAIADGKCVRLNLLLPGESKTRWLSGTVAWSRPPQAGIEFHLTATEQAEVENSVTYLLSTQGLWKTLQRTVTGNLRTYLKQKLPDYMMPSAFVLMKALPLTPNGKVDRRILPTPDNSVRELENKFIAPSTSTEVKVAAIWAEVLGLQQISINDNFFELGGHSLLATQIISRIRETFFIEIPLRNFFESPTIFSLAEIIEKAENFELDKQCNSQIKANTFLPLLPRKQDRQIPLSIAQKDIWHFHELFHDSSASNSPIVLRFTGEFSPQVLESSLNEIIRRHEILRTNFSIKEGEPVQVITPSLTLPLRLINLQDIPLAKRELESKIISIKETQYRFDLTNEPLIRITLLQLNPSEHLLLITMHHIITDAWSHGIFLEELGTIYNAFLSGLSTQKPLPELAIQYADFTLWEQECLNEEVLEKQLSYWQQKLAGIPQPLNLLPTLQPQQSNNSKFTSLCSIVLAESLVTSIKALSRSQAVTIFVILLTALKILLYKWSGQTDIIIMAATANRKTPAIEKMLGCFINDISLRSFVEDSQTGINLLEEVKQTVSEGVANQDIPLQKVVKAVSSLTSVRTISVSMAPPMRWHNQLLNCQVTTVPVEHELWDAEHIPLELYIRSQGEDSQTIEIAGYYSTVFFSNQNIEHLFSDYQEILHKLVEHPNTKLSEF
jgi:amino acid adenylation domain-containing protein